MVVFETAHHLWRHHSAILIPRYHTFRCAHDPRHCLHTMVGGLSAKADFLRWATLVTTIPECRSCFTLRWPFAFSRCVLKGAHFVAVRFAYAHRCAHPALGTPQAAHNGRTHCCGVLAGFFRYIHWAKKRYYRRQHLHISSHRLPYVLVAVTLLYFTRTLAARFSVCF